MKPRMTSIFDYLTDNVIKKIDEIGYKFLADMGYDTTGVESEDKRKLLWAEMKKRKEKLYHQSLVDKEKGKTLFWFELWKEDKFIATSKGITVIYKGEESDTSSATRTK